MPVVVIINSRVTKEIASGAASVGETLHVAVLVVLGACPAHGLRCLVNEAEVDPRHVREPLHRAPRVISPGTALPVCLFLPFCWLEPV